MAALSDDELRALVGKIGRVTQGEYQRWYVELEQDASGHGWHIWLADRPARGPVGPGGTVWDVWADDLDQVRTWFDDFMVEWDKAVADIPSPDLLALRNDILNVLGTVVDALPPGCARVEVEGVLPDVPWLWGCTLQAVDARPDQTEVAVEVPDTADVLYVGFGEDSRLEIAMEGKGWRDPRFSSSLDQLEAIATAVAAGRFEETTWIRRGLLVKSVGALGLRDGRYRVTARHTPAPLWGRSRVKRLYRGYGRPAESSSASRSR